MDIVEEVSQQKSLIKGHLLKIKPEPKANYSKYDMLHGKV
jgi:hypothetical protein